MSHSCSLRMAAGFLLLLPSLLVGTNVRASDAPKDPLAGTVLHAGLLPLHVDVDEGRVLMDVADLPADLLMVSTIEHALGSNDVGLDRAQNGEPRLVRFQRVGKRVLLIQENTKFLAHTSDRDEARAATEAFAEAVLWSTELIKSERAPAAQLVDVSGLVKLDLHGVADRLKLTGQGPHSLDADRSSLLPDACQTFPNNVELSGLLTFSGSGEGPFVQQVAADPKSLSITQRLSLIRLPEAGFRSRAYHPASGGFSIGRYDFAQAIDAPLEQRFQPRFRLEKTDPALARSPVKKPIVFYLDRGTPEPIRSALLEGANWWRDAFDAAGFIDGFRAELAPAGMSMSDVRFNTITWTHRATRGWSYGGGLIDPRTGEIIKGYVNLGSQRVRQDLLIAEGLLAPYRAGADPALKQEALNMALHRLKQLAAHEVGHALGFAHNFAASRNGDGSVLDYPHPQFRFDGADGIRLDQPYGRGVGTWDKFLVAHAYSQFPIADEASRLATLRAEIRSKGYDYVSDPDARAPGDAHAEGLLWDVPGDPLTGFFAMMKARERALRRFSDGALPPDRQNGEAARRLVPIYLLHRYQTEAVARLLGGTEYRYGTIADSDWTARAVPADTQARALAALTTALDVGILRLPERTLATLNPPANDYAKSPEDFDSQMLPMFDPIEAGRVATAVVLQFALDPQRLNRMAWQHAADSASPGPELVFDQLIRESWLERHAKGTDRALQTTRNWTCLDGALQVLQSGLLHAEVAATWRQQLRQLTETLEQMGRQDADASAAASLIRRYLDDPTRVPLRALPRIPPGAPI
ncbi:hypothetical protein C7S18_10890 [Ahniella affigens]|uniref:Peptidase n=1 Tax=Ahniella affigens TaxID=2021234 RepID=A0A2P1PS67_9GAMM|nr:zinc-dependent metalloprotease [Ahniella affigens]AVP97674.1 hypothetical protein C7S18_10890 [Ahniella affigens]